MDEQYRDLAGEYAAKSDEYYDQSRPEMLQFIPEHCNAVLEVGCSSGAFGARLKEQRPNCEVWGVEPDVRSAQIAAGRIDHVINGILSPDLPDLKDKRFDAICFFDVLEHLVNPERALIDCKNYLAEGGVIVASIPNILQFYQIGEILYRQDWRYREAGILDSTHLRFFTKKSIERMFQTTGFKRIKITGINPQAGLKFQIANTMLLGRISDWKYVQFAIQAWER
jgi:SAM-dependent methyltransferase